MCLFGIHDNANLCLNLLVAVYSTMLDYKKRPKEWGNLDLNQGPTGYESAALTTELLPHKEIVADGSKVGGDESRRKGEREENA